VPLDFKGEVAAQIVSWVITGLVTLMLAGIWRMWLTQHRLVGHIEKLKTAQDAAEKREQVLTAEVDRIPQMAMLLETLGAGFERIDRRAEKHGAALAYIAGNIAAQNGDKFDVSQLLTQ
jgi:hypothetical protein